MRKNFYFRPSARRNRGKMRNFAPRNITDSIMSKEATRDKRLRAAVTTVCALTIVAMASATLIGTSGGQAAADRAVYSTPWFTALWALGAALGTIYFLRRHVRRAPILALHASLLLILAGAGLTRLTAHRGRLHLREGVAASEYTDEDGGRRKLPFQVRLDRFEVDYHEGQAAAMDYRSTVTIKDGGGTERAVISMNHVCDHGGARLYQASYDDDLRGTTLAVSEDRWGTSVTYAGYALLLLSLLWTLLDPRGRFRRLLRGQREWGGGRSLTLLLCLMATLGAKAQRTVSPEVADELGRALIVYNGRVCPVETFALDFTKKMHGSRSYNGLSATQVLAGVMLYPDDWLGEPFMRIKGKQLRERLGGLGEYVAPADLLGGGYRLGPMLREAQGRKDKLSEQVLDADDRLMLLMGVMRLEAARMFPYPSGRRGEVAWYSPTQAQPKGMAAAQRQYVRSILPMTARLAASGQEQMAVEAVAKLRKYQAAYGGKSVPPAWRMEAEHWYNAVPFATLLFMANLALGFLSAFWLTRRRGYGWFTAGMAISWALLTLCLGLRWAASGNVPMGNGYETMLLVAWLVMAAALPLSRRVRPMTTFGLLASGLMLLVSHLSQMDPAISQRMPVLNSPLLTVHVSVIMLSYALLSLTFMAAAAWFLTAPFSGRKSVRELRQGLKPLSELFLYPAVATLAAGIFIGAVWANVSWGNYWSWDPKETWALITLLIYAAPLHQSSYAALRREKWYHLYLLLAFVSLIVTYFGVNYFMSGMHSYA